jgi:hypothetical protein
VADDPRLQQLLDKLLDSDSTPEVVCRDCPELLTEVRKRWQKMREVEAQLEALFPTPGLDPDVAVSGRPDVAALAEDLKRFERSEPVATHRSGRLERAITWVRRHPTAAAIVAAILLLVMLLLGGSLWLAVQQARRRDKVDADPKGRSSSTSIAEPDCRACSLLPGTADERQKVDSLADRAVAAKGSTGAWIYRYFLFAKAPAEYRQGRLDSAVSPMQGEASKVMGPAPRLVLAIAQHREGNQDQARKMLARQAHEGNPRELIKDRTAFQIPLLFVTPLLLSRS